MRGVPASLASIVLLAAWFGAAALTVAVVTPGAFAVLPTRTLAGALVGRVLPVLFWSGMLVGIVALALAWPQRTGRRWECVALGLLILSSAVAQLGIAPRLASIRSAAGGVMDALDPSDPRRQAFGRLHGLSVACIGVGGLAAMLALGLALRFVSRRAG
jgi:Domain of unknown function (DUF4149)